MALNPDEELELLELEEEEYQEEQNSSIQRTPEALPSPPPSDISYGESFLRGTGQGATFGFSDEMIGAGGAVVDALRSHDLSRLSESYQKYRDAERQANRKAQEANPMTYIGGNLVGGLAVPVPGMGTLSAATKGLTAVEKIAASGLIGASAGGLGAAGMSEADNLKDFGKDVIKGAKTGAAFGAAIRAVPEGVKAVGKPIGGWVYNKIISFQPAKIIGEATRKGYQGKDLTNLEKQFERLNSLGKELGDEALGAKKALSQEYDNLLETLKSSPDKVDLKPFLQRMKAIEAEFRGIKSPRVQGDLDEVVGTVKNYTEGLEQQVPQKTIIPGKPSSSDKALSDLALRKAQIEEQGMMASTSLPSGVDELGRPILIPKIRVQGDEVDNINVLRPMVDKPAIPDAEKIKMITQRVGGSDQLSRKELFELQQLIGEQGNFSASPLASNQGKIFAGRVDNALKDTVNKAIPELAEQNQRYSALQNALKVFGLDDTEAFIKNVKTGELELSPTVMNKIESYIRQAGSESAPRNKAAQGIKLFIDNLKAAGIKGVDELDAKIADVGEDFELAREIAGKSLYTGMGRFPLVNTKNAAFLGNILGRAAKSTVEAGAPILDPAISAVSRSQVTGLSRDVYNSSPDQLAQMASVLKGSGFENQATALEEALANGNRAKSNAIIFSLMQNPEARKIIRGE